MMQAIENLYQAGAVQPDDAAETIAITDVGRRLTESDVVALPVAVSADEGDTELTDEGAPPPQPQKPTIRDWIVALIESI